jgi:hypothetical protein
MQLDDCELEGRVTAGLAVVVVAPRGDDPSEAVVAPVADMVMPTRTIAGAAITLQTRCVGIRSQPFSLPEGSDLYGCNGFKPPKYDKGASNPPRARRFLVSACCSGAVVGHGSTSVS